MARRRGRRPGAADTRDEILAAAREAFAHKGYDRATIRAIAAAAAVDPALVYHYFGSKEQLILAVMNVPVDLDVMTLEILNAPAPKSASAWFGSSSTSATPRPHWPNCVPA